MLRSERPPARHSRPTRVPGRSQCFLRDDHRSAGLGAARNFQDSYLGDRSAELARRHGRLPDVCRLSDDQDRAPAELDEGKEELERDRRDCQGASDARTCLIAIPVVSREVLRPRSHDLGVQLESHQGVAKESSASPICLHEDDPGDSETREDDSRQAGTGADVNDGTIIDGTATRTQEWDQRGGLENVPLNETLALPRADEASGDCLVLQEIVEAQQLVLRPAVGIERTHGRTECFTCYHTV